MMTSKNKVMIEIEVEEFSQLLPLLLLVFFTVDLKLAS